jgi:hypothetical protein
MAAGLRSDDAAGLAIPTPTGLEKHDDYSQDYRHAGGSAYFRMLRS